METNNTKNDPRGSQWRKWDLHVHTPYTKLDNQYVISADKDVWNEFCDKIEQSDVEVFGITDYFSADNYFTFLEKYKSKHPNSKKVFFLNIELRLNESVNKELEEVNVHLLFNHDHLEKVSKFLSKLKVVKTGQDETPITCSELKTETDYKAATITRKSINDAFVETFGTKAIRQDHFLVLTAANNDGVRPERGQYRKEAITDEIDKLSDGFFGGIQNQEHFLDIHRLEDKDQLIGKKPIISGSDARSFDALGKYLGKRDIGRDSDGKEIILKDVTWIKADPTFEGLRQIIYEPEPGERIWIGPIVPDQKSDLKVIQKIKFSNTNDFPAEIKFNKNLCSIIGSRSSGKSALLAYVAHAVDKKLTETRVDGPGDGFPWSKVDFQYSVEWENGLSNDESPGKIVYIPQNYLFDVSKKPDDIKEKIEPVLFKKLPTFRDRYIKTINDIGEHNTNISEQIDIWFLLSNQITNLESKLKDFGDKDAIKKEKEKIESQIEKIKKEHKLTEEDVKKFQEISTEVARYKDRIRQIEIEISGITIATEERGYFDKISFTLSPALENLPKKLQDVIKDSLENDKVELLGKINKQVISYKTLIQKEKEEIDKKILDINNENKILIKQYEKNIELQELVKKLTEHNSLVEKIQGVGTEKSIAEATIKEHEKTIKSEIEKRKSVLDRLKLYLESLNQNDTDIIFGLECNFDSLQLEAVTQKINTRLKSDFVDVGKLKMSYIRSNPAKFLSAVYLEEQKINQGHTKESATKEVLLVTEKILFSAQIDKDKIGGFSESTMTPGKRAFFALKLILDESDETWPLLIDQPEDDLDSRSIYDYIVPFLKKRKKERQIIMVSHNANLVIGSDSEQIIVANRNGDDMINVDDKQFNYLTGSIEHTKEKDKECDDTLAAQGIREHACEILDGGKIAFEHRRNKYNLTKL